MTRGSSIALLTIACALATAQAPAAEAAYTPGVVNQGPLGARDFERMERGGVETLRFIVRWRGVEPSEGSFDFSTVDAIVAGAATAGVEPVPFVYGSPAWVAGNEKRPPLDSAADRAAWRRFLTALVERYGPGGEFWAGVARPQPIRRWQIWNEPNFEFYWHPRPSPAEYAKLLSISARAIDAADRRAKIVMAGVAPIVSGTPWWTFLRRLYGIRGFARDVDVVALHPYSPTISDLRKQVELARRIMAANGERREPLAITEIGWSSGHRRAPLVVGREGQADLLRRSFRLLGANAAWRISDVQWYSWQDTLAVEAFCVFCEHAGLFDLEGMPKPSWRAYRRAVR